MVDKIITGPKSNYKVPLTSIGQYLYDSTIKFKDAISQVDAAADEISETYSSIKKRSVRVAIALSNLKINSHHIVAFCSNNSLDNVVAIVAAFYLGTKISNLEPSLTAKQTQHLIQLVAPKILFVEESSVALIEQSIKDLESKPELIVFGESKNYRTFRELDVPQEGEEDFEPTRVDPYDDAVLFFSSGTTGLPKAIRQSHNSILSQVILIGELDFKNVNFTYSPLYWYSGIAMFICTFISGGCRVFAMDKSAENTLTLIDKFKVNGIFMAPIHSYNLTRCENVKNYDLSSVKCFLLGGTKVNTSQLDALANLFKNAAIVFAYGLTEVGLASYSVHETSETNTSSASAGTPSPETSIKIVDANTNSILGPNLNGEICVKSPGVSKGYYHVNSNIFDEDGFLKTGDVGYFDDRGFLFIVERVKEMFKFRSRPVVPSFLEGILLEHPAVKEAVVWGRPQGEEGDAPAACVVLRENVNATEDEIASFVADKVIERDRLVGGITFVNDLPKTPTGKVIRSAVKEMMLTML